MATEPDPLPPFHGRGGSSLQLTQLAAAAGVLTAAVVGWLVGSGESLLAGAVLLVLVVAIVTGFLVPLAWRLGVNAALREVRSGLRELVRDRAESVGAADRLLGD